MKGSVYKRKGGASWTVKYDGPRVSGKRQLKYKSGFQTKKDAERWLRRTLGSLDDGTFVEPSKLTLGDFLTGEWLPSLEVRDLRPTTRAGYASNVSTYVVPRLGDVPLQQLSPVHLNGLYSELLRHGRVQREGGLSARSVRYVHTILRRALADAVKWGRVTRNAADSADPPAASAAREDAERARNTWTPEQLATFLGHVRPHRLGAALQLAATTGMRRGEVLGLRWQDLDLDAGRLTIRQTVIATGYSSPKTSRGTRSVSLDAGTVEVLRAHRKRQAEERLALGGDYDDSDLVFCEPDGTWLHPSGFSKAFERLVLSSGLPRIRLHDLRHTHASIGLAANVHPKVMQERLGHSTIAITMDTYSHVVPTQDAAAAELIAAQVDGAVGRSSD